MQAGRPELMVREWVHSFEEDSGDAMVFRPADFPFPPQRRPRTSIDLGPDGRARWAGGPAPDDRPVSDSGTWTFEGDELTLRLQGRPEERYRVESVDEERLVLRKLG